MPNVLESHQRKRLIAHYFLITYFIVLFTTSNSVAFADAWADGAASVLFIVAAFLCYGLIYLLPALVITTLAWRLSDKCKSIPLFWLPVYCAAVFSTGFTTLLLYANAKIYALYGMFINGFIINLLITPGGIESLGGSGASDIGFALIALVFLLAHALLLWLVHAVYARFQKKLHMPQHMYRYIAGFAMALTLALHSYYAYDAYTKNQVGMLAQSIPFFQTVSARGILKNMGFKPSRARNISIKGKLDYPLQPLKVTPPGKPYNIIWLAAESWRADMLDAEIMPNTWQFSAQAQRFDKNYSGGNGTRMGVFSMFMGLPGNYWFSFLRERRGAAIIDVLQQQQYQMSLYTSAHFSYPEFDKTVFSAVSADQLHEVVPSRSGWENDKENVSSMLSFIKRRDRNKPFFTFMFFESPHARYYFPEDSVIRRPYRDDINYATLSKAALSRDISNIKNRYINSVHHLDRQFGRVFDYLRSNDLLDSTIVILVGDHGEEFMEHGFWGHNSTFVDEQIRTPLVIRVPGIAPRVSSEMTSHMDIVPTLMPLLGVTNPADDYSTGYNLFGSEKRTYTYVADWERVAYIDNEIKITQMVNIRNFGGMQVSDSNDHVLPKELAADAVKAKNEALTGLLRDLSNFLISKKPQP